MSDTSTAATIFASKNARDLNSDPEPYVDDAEHDYERHASPTADGRKLRLNPRREFDFTQRIAASFALPAIRSKRQAGASYSTILSDYETYLRTYEWLAPQHHAHARRVLERLARMSGS